jgi:hypothetical protein
MAHHPTPHRRGLLRALAVAFTVVVLAGPLPGTVERLAAETALPAVEHPVVVELFTSEGCSSCPPADALLGELAGLPGVIALSLHVDYWDYIGWKDRFASPIFTQRQRAYGESLHKRFVYTPQIVIDGVRDVVGSRRGQVLAAVAEQGRRKKPLELTFDAAESRILIGRGEAPAQGASVWLAVFDEQRESEVTRGENAGRHLASANVVRDLVKVANWTGEPLAVPLDLAAAADAGRDGCAVIVQEGIAGPVLGAIKMLVPRS